MTSNAANIVTDSGDRWHTFTEILSRLHSEGIYIHSDHLAEFFLRHQLPVSLYHVPEHLKPLAERVNANYQGDMARLEDIYEPY